jgi:cytochrome c
MKKKILLVTIVCLAAQVFMFCGSKKQDAESVSTEEEVIKDKPSNKDLIAEGKRLVEGRDCQTCHHSINKLIGPSHTDVAKKYDFTKENVSMLAKRIIAGGSGVWGQMPMNAHPDLSQENAEKMAMYVLSLDGETPKD